MKSQKLTLVWLKTFIISTLLIGIFFRFVNLDRKVYWGDETYTSMRVSGYTQREVIQQVFDGQIIKVEDLLKYQRLNKTRSVGDTIHSLASEDAQHPPFYYTLLRLWLQWFGDSIAATRSLSAIISLLAFPSIYWLSSELFKSPIVGWIAIGVLAVSPFHVLYAQEAREYSLWTVTIIVSSAALLRARRRQTKIAWGIYVFSLVSALYTFLFSVLVAVCHGIYVFISEHFRLSENLNCYVFSSLLSFAVFAPWLWVIAHSNTVEKTTSWISKAMPISSLAQKWAGNLSRLYFDINLDSSDPLLIIVPPIAILCCLSIYAIFFLLRNAPKPAGLFILLLIGVTAFALILPDLLLQGRRSSVPRYAIPSYVGIQLALAYLFSVKITSGFDYKRKLWQFFLVLLMSLGVVSCAISSNSQIWWKNDPTYYYPQISQIINASAYPLLISDIGPANITSLSYLLDPKVKLQLWGKSNTSDALERLNNINGFTDVFLYRPSENLLNKLDGFPNYRVAPSFKPGELWQIEVPQSVEP